jgi:cyclopropane-fatty-acyl-phospholipid synthase
MLAHDPHLPTLSPTVPLRPNRSRPMALIDRCLRSWVTHALGGAPIRIVLRDGTEMLPSRTGSAAATVVLKDRATLVDMLTDPERRFGEGYCTGAIEVEGDLVAGIEGVYRVRERRRPPVWSLRGGRGSHSLTASKHNVHHHYDLGNDFYRLWLDREMVYTCAYFPEPGLGLEAAQRAKMDLVCRKLSLRPGDRVVEAGCGWGALALHMAREYGVRVTACNISEEQVRFARARAFAEGLADRVEFVYGDYRVLRGRFNVFVSVGMLEHVGLENYRTLGAVIDAVLPPGRGRGLLHFIGQDQPGPLNAWIARHVFPGAYAPTLAQVVEKVLRPARLSVLDVENLRLHYARTLDHWRTRFETAVEGVTSRFGEGFTRAWRLYLAGSQAAFTTGSMQLFQVVFARSGDNDIPWTRATP